MKAMWWVVKNAGLDVWDGRRSLARNAAMVVGAVAAAAALGLAFSALWAMFSFPQPGSILPVASGASIAKVDSCEKALAGAPKQLLGPSFARWAWLNCRREGSEFFVERWTGSGRDGQTRLASMTLELKAAGKESINALDWRPAEVSWSARAFAEALGLAAPTRASRGIEGSAWAHDQSLGQWVARAATGWLQAIGLALGAILWAFLLSWPALLVLAMMGFGSFVGWDLGGRAGVLKGLGASAALALTLAPLASAALLMSVSWDEAGPKFRTQTRSAPMENCDAKSRAGDALVLRDPAASRDSSWLWLGCREEDGQMMAVAVAGKDKSQSEVEAAAAVFFDVGALTLSDPAEPNGAWTARAFLEQAGWLPATKASRAWASASPRLRESGPWSRERVAAATAAWGVGMAALLSLAFGLIFIRQALASAIAMGRAWFDKKGEELWRGSEFLARAQKRELDREIKAGRAPRSRGQGRL